MASRASPLSEKDLIVFDMDGTLTPSKAPMQKSMAHLLARLLGKKYVAVIGGGSYKQFNRQFIGQAKFPPALMDKLFLFPVSGTAFYCYRGGRWKAIYAKNFSIAQKKKIFSAFREAFRRIGYKRPKMTYGKVIEDRGSQITFSALGQDIVMVLGIKKGVAAKERWHKQYDNLRRRLMDEIEELLPQFTVRMGGLTSVDVTKFGIDKAYGIRQIEKHLRVPVRKMVFVGDALFPGGNDYAARRTGVQCIAVRGPADTKRVIKKILNAAR